VEGRPVDERKRLTMRLAVVAFGYIVYRLIEPESLIGALLLGFGVWLVGVGRVERKLNPQSTDRQRMLQTLGTRVGIAMIVVGTVLAVI
jgi:uncharacterized membrane protein YidH (DUF202 family)